MGLECCSSYSLPRGSYLNQDFINYAVRLNVFWHFLWMHLELCTCCMYCSMINSPAPEGFDYSLKLVNFKLISTINILSIFGEIAIRWMPQYLIDHQSTLVQAMAWCHQATSHCLSQCWPRCLPPYGVTRPHWVKLMHYWEKRWSCMNNFCNNLIKLSFVNASHKTNVGQNLLMKTHKTIDTFFY